VPVRAYRCCRLADHRRLPHDVVPHHEASLTMAQVTSGLRAVLSSPAVYDTFQRLMGGHVGRTDFAHGDHAALIDSITRKLLPLGDEMRFLCGHGPGSSFGHERSRNPFLQGG
jgi:hypothetical protein